MVRILERAMNSILRSGEVGSRCWLQLSASAVGYPLLYLLGENCNANTVNMKTAFIFLLPGRKFMPYLPFLFYSSRFYLYH
jgi:hypothetical protein